MKIHKNSRIFIKFNEFSFNFKKFLVFSLVFPFPFLSCLTVLYRLLLFVLEFTMFLVQFNCYHRVLLLSVFLVHVSCLLLAARNQKWSSSRDISATTWGPPSPLLNECYPQRRLQQRGRRRQGHCFIWGWLL